jgi:dolichol-phosphate mannosyltransferase
MKTLIVIPTYNERANLGSLIAQVRAIVPDAHVLIVDDASPDGTGELVDEIAAKDDHVHAMHRSGKLGLGTAYLEGFAWGMEQGYDRFFEMDADHSHNPRYLPDFIAALDEGYDLVVGSRNVAGGNVEGWGLERHIISKGGSLYSRTILGVEINDLTTGYKAFTRRALVAVNLASVKSNGYSFQIEMTYRVLMKGLRAKEVPIIFVDRRVGQSKMSSRIFLEAIGVVWKLRAASVIGML